MDSVLALSQSPHTFFHILDSVIASVSSFAKWFTYSYPLLLLVYLGCFVPIHEALQSDIECLKSIKDSLEDPKGFLDNWDFTNETEGFICMFTGITCWQGHENRVLGIRLSDMGLKGSFPLGLEMCPALTGLDLSKNQINGTIPSHMSSFFPYATTLDLSSNNLSGEIPPSMAKFLYLNVLNLENNQLTGEIPPELGSLGRIKIFRVANNRLAGPVPNFGVLTTEVSYANNSGLCGAPSLERCIYPSTEDDTRRDSFIGGFAIGSALFMTLALYLGLFGLPRAVRTRTRLFRRKNEKVNITTMAYPEQEGIDTNRVIMKLEKYVPRMSFMEMERATDNFSHENEVGSGSLGKVYKALVPNGWLLAIKRLHQTEDLDDEFASEIMTLGRLRHQNLVPLIGFCYQGKEKLLVYKYMLNGSLHEWLHSTEDRAEALSWAQRMKIAVGVAKALSWLHYTCYVNVAHNGLCSKCILLDRDFEPKISKFWEASVLNSTSSWSVSDSGFECPDNFSPFTKDVYCFGIVLLELITRKEAYELSFSTEVMFGSSSTTSSLEVDAVLKHTGFDDVISQFLQIAKNCVKFIPNQRPTMYQVYEAISSIEKACTINTGLEISCLRL